jgi:hypothetical protein
MDFDRDTDPSEFDGSNGQRTELTDLWESLIVDPTDSSYTPEVGVLFGLDHIVSLGEDNSGNLYLVDFVFGQLFNGQYPGPGLGEIFRITPYDPADFDRDGDVDTDGADSLNWLRGYGKGITSPGPQEAPEPSTVAFLMAVNCGRLVWNRPSRRFSAI